MKKLNDSDIKISKNGDCYEFSIKPTKNMIDAMRIFLKDQELQKGGEFYHDPWFALFRKMPRKLWKRVSKGLPIPVNRKQVFFINGDFYAQGSSKIE